MDEATPHSGYNPTWNVSEAESVFHCRSDLPVIAPRGRVAG
jgi:hypothetical protein